MKTLKVLIELHATPKCLSCHQLLVEFASKTKSFAIAILVIFFFPSLFPSCCCFWMDWQKLFVDFSSVSASGFCDQYLT